MISNLASILKTHFGFDSFRTGQEEAIQSLLDHQHTLVIMPTGAGKSLIYQFAALQFDGLTLVISPLIALMKDQVDALNRKGIPATFINSAIPTFEQTQRLMLLAQGKYKLVYVAPERLRSATFLQSLQSRTLSLLAVDECHCISEWGHDFRPDYLRIAETRRKLGNPLTVALTATATPKVQDDIVRLLGLPESTKRIVTGFNRPNLMLEVKYTADVEAKFRALNELLGTCGSNSDLQQGAALIYTGTRRDAEEVAEFVRVVCKFKAEHYHAGLPAEDRSRIQEGFINGKTPVVVATNAFGMGIDRADVRQVIHYSLPGSLEAYYQEAGRAGRDGLPAKVVLLYDPQDRALQEFFIQSGIVSLEELQIIYRAIGNADDELWMTGDDFSRRTDLHPVKVKVGLAELERAGAVEHLGDDGVRMRLQKGKWDIAAMQRAALRSREHAQYRMEQLEHIIHYAESNHCRRKILLNHFGDTGGADASQCCDNCLSQSEKSEASGDVTQMSHAERATLVILDAVRKLGVRQVGREKLAQILKGSKAQDILKFHYDQHVYYAKLAAIQQKQIEDMIRELTSLGYFKVVGGEYPVLSLTPKGEAAIQKKSSIELKMPRGLSGQAIEKKKAQLQAGGTVEYTAQLLADGNTPEQIALQRGLTMMTIYGHCAKLIEAGQLAVDKVIKKDTKEKIEAAIRKIGSIQFLFPIKSLLADEITYEMIRCVVAGYGKTSEGFESSEAPRPNDDEIEELILECVKSLPGKLPRSGVAKLLIGSNSERVEAYRSHPLYNHLRGKSRSEVMSYVDKLLDEARLQKAENGCLMPGAHDADKKTFGITRNSLPDPIASYMFSSHPRPLIGSWQTGFALDFHSSFTGAEWNRSGIGGLTYRLKYQSDASALPALIEHTRKLFLAYPEMDQFDVILPVSSSTQRSFSPVHEFCKALSCALNKPVQTFLVKARQTQPQKEMQTLVQKRDNVAGAFAINGDITGRRILVVDDLFDSGATLEEITRLLLKNRASRVNVLTLTRTIHADS
jgi:ATP-dependent DNA helicase RecQ